MPVFLRHRDGCTPMPHQEQDPKPALDYARHRRWCASCPPFAVGAERRSFDCGARRLNRPPRWPFAPSAQCGAVTLRRVTTTRRASWGGVAVRGGPRAALFMVALGNGSRQPSSCSRGVGSVGAPPRLFAPSPVVFAVSKAHQRDATASAQAGQTAAEQPRSVRSLRGGLSRAGTTRRVVNSASLGTRRAAAPPAAGDALAPAPESAASLACSHGATGAAVGRVTVRGRGTVGRSLIQGSAESAGGVP